MWYVTVVERTLSNAQESGDWAAIHVSIGPLLVFGQWIA